MMARSQDELIDFLLAEIASSGAFGESFLSRNATNFGRLSQWEKSPARHTAISCPSTSTLISYLLQVTA